MRLFSNPNIQIATEADIISIKDLLNSAYRGESSKEGWTNEAHLIDGGVRSDIATIQQLMQQPGSVFLKYMEPGKEITGCLNLQKQGNKIYLGMFSVSPKLQGGGIGKQLLQASEEYTKHLYCNAIYMTVISVRSDLINWYMRHGYSDTGERKTFHEDGKTGRHLQELEFMTLEKKLN